MKPIQWIVATAIASVVMISYVHAFVFPRTEGTRLQVQIDSVLPVLIEIKQELGELKGLIKGLRNDKD